MESKIINYFELIKEKYVKLQGIMEPYMNSIPQIKHIMKDIQSLYDIKLKSLKPQVMVFGIYNAGKSSIINELLKADKAIVNDIPTTDKIDYYEWNGYEIADTPGVGAPIEHEEVTNEHLKKADVVLFVMSTTGSNEKAENYIRMKNIVDSGKKVIIILNDKNGDLYNNDEILSAIKIKVRQNMQKVNIEDVESKYCIIVVNASRARNARLRNKPGLYNKSNFTELERIILSELKNTSTFNIMENTVYEIEQNLNKLIEIINSNISDDDVKYLNNILNTLRQQKVEIRKDVNEYIKNKAARLAEALPNVIWSKRNKQDEIDKCIQNEIEKLANRTKKHLEEELKNLQDILIVDFENMIAHFEKVKFSSYNNSDNINIGEVKSVENNTDIVDILNTAKNILNLVQNGASIFSIQKKLSMDSVVPNLSTIVISKILPKSLVNSVAGTAVGSVVGRSISDIGVIITVIKVIKKFLEKEEEERRRKHAEAEAKNEYERRKAEAELQARQDLQQKCLYLTDDIAEELSYAVNDIIRNTIGNLESELKEQINSKNENVNNKMDAINKLQLLVDEYDKIRIELKGRAM